MSVRFLLNRVGVDLFGFCLANGQLRRALLPILLLVATSLASAAPPVALTDPEGLAGLSYRLIGPPWPGRMTRVAGISGTHIFYAGAATGGLWKTYNDGLTWESILDGQQECCVGSIALAPSNSDIVYVGGGEANIRGMALEGHGIYKSMDGGKTWAHVWKQDGQIGTMAVDPNNPDIAFAAVLGHPFGPNPERGIYRTKDGGKTWVAVLQKADNASGADVAIDPNHPSTVFATLWHPRRTPWSMDTDGPNSGLYVSHDGGDSWQRITGHGLPSGEWGKSGIGVARSDSRRVYAVIEAHEELGGIYRSDDGGENWTHVNADHRLKQKAYYFTTLTINPNDKDEVWFPQRDLYRTSDAGATMTAVPGARGGDDFHDVWIDPKDPQRIIVGLDSGVQVSLDKGRTWYVPPMPLSQFYTLDLDNRVPFRVAGTLQDVGSAQGPSNSLDRSGIRNSDWYPVGGGEAGGAISDQNDPNVFYAGNYGSSITRFDYRTKQAMNISIYPYLPQGFGASELKYRFQYTSPLAMSPFNSKVIYHAANVLFRSEDGGTHWTAISGDLTRDDKSKQQRTGGIFGDNVGVEHYDTIIAVAESPVQKGLIWVGSDDGLVHVTRDGGKTWKNVTTKMTGLPEWASVTCIEPSRFDPGTAYVVVGADRLDDHHPYLFKTADGGETWQRLDTNLSSGTFLKVVREDPVSRQILYVGTSEGMAVSLDGGREWNSLKLNLPPVPVFGLKIKGNSLVAATYGRSIWVFDHLSVLREISSKIRAQPHYLFHVPDVIRWRYSSWYAVPASGGNGPPDLWRGTNPAMGAVIYYWLGKPPSGPVSIDILDGQNRVIRRLSSVAAESPRYKENAPLLEKPALTTNVGINTAVWNLSYEGAKLIPGSLIKSGAPDNGPTTLPGVYRVRLNVDGESLTQPVRVSMDPRVHVTEVELESRLKFSLTVRAEIDRVTNLVLRLRNGREELSNWAHSLHDRSGAEELARNADQLVAKLDDLELKLHNAKATVVYDIHSRKGGAMLYAQLAALFSWSTDSDGPVTQGLRDTFGAERRGLDSYAAELQDLLGQQIAGLNTEAVGLGLPRMELQKVETKQ
jgi:photosystem II stability/assembly factor-like uncharacterized protein